ncbi:hypothetical protein D3C78_1674420 [compost metagenome]
MPAWPRLVLLPLTTMPSAITTNGCQNIMLASMNARPRLGSPQKVARDRRDALGWRARKVN